jgi:riboflavin synthase
MFAGIIESVCKVTAVRPGGTTPRGAPARGSGAVRLEIELGQLAAGLQQGASVAINGACLTLVEARGGVSGFEVVPETWRLTNLRFLQTGDLVNVERSLRMGDRIDGHFVQGHVEGLGTVDRVARDAGEYRIWVRATPELMRYIVRKGSIALDGVSLTIADVDGERFSVALIPTTLTNTVLRLRQPADRVNIETDILARLVVSRLEAVTGRAATMPGEGLTWERLLASGFLP